MRTTSASISAAVRGRPGPRFPLPSYFCAISFRCHANKVSGETIVAMSAKHFRPDCFAPATALVIVEANRRPAVYLPCWYTNGDSDCHWYTNTVGKQPGGGSPT